MISILVNRSSYHRKLTFRFAMTTTSNDYDSTFKILVLGDSGVGKTCLIYRYTEGIFSEAYVSTIGEFLLNFLSELIHSRKLKEIKITNNCQKLILLIVSCQKLPFKGEYVFMVHILMFILLYTGH